jgi:HEAT repeat protein
MRVVSGIWAVGLAVILLGTGCSGQPKAVIKGLVSDDPAVRSEAAIRLGEARSKEAVDALVAVLNDSEETVRVNVIRALGDIGDPKAIAAISPFVADPLSPVRMAACQALGSLRDMRGVPALEKALYDQDELVRIVAARALAGVPGPESLEVLLRVAMQDESERIRSLVVAVVHERRAREAVPRLESALRAESDLVRANAAMALGGIGDRSSLPALFRSLDDPFYKVRCLAAHAIAKIAPGDAEAKAAVVKRLAAEENAMAIVDLAWALGSLGDRSGMETLRTLLFKGEPEEVRAEAAIALGDLGDASELPVLKKALADKMGIVRSRVAEAIDKIRGLKAA